MDEHRLPYKLGQENLVCDLRRRFPLPDGSVKLVFAEHVLEHFGYPEGIEHVLRECHRVLQPGGILRAIIPDAERYLRAYAEGNDYFLGAAGAGIGPKMAVINKVFRENEFHKYAYDYETLKLLLEGTGFRGIRRSGFRESQYEELNLDLDEFERRLQSLYVEAVK